MVDATGSDWDQLDSATEFNSTNDRVLIGQGANVKRLSGLLLPIPTAVQSALDLKAAASAVAAKGPRLEAAFTIPTLSMFTAATRNATGFAAADTDYGIRFKGPVNTTGANDLNYVARAIAAGAAGWRATARIRRNLGLLQWVGAGLMLRESSTGKTVNAYLGTYSTTQGFCANTGTNDTTISADALLARLDMGATDAWIRVTDNLTNRIWSLSFDGENFKDYRTEGRTVHCTPDQVGFYVTPASNSGNLGSNELVVYGLSWQYEELT